MTFAKIGRLLLPFMLILFFASPVLAWQGRTSAAWGQGFCPFFGGWTGGWTVGWLGMLMNILFWVLVCLAIVYLIRRLFNSTTIQRTPMDTESGPLNILKARYARGEISVETFKRMKNDLL